MFKNELENTLKKLAGIFTLKQYARKTNSKVKLPKLSPNTPVWNALDFFCENGCDCVSIGGDKCVDHSTVLKVRIPFFLLLAELESRIFRIHEWSGKDISVLNEKYLNELNKELLNSDLIKLQKQYKNRSEFKNDLKAVSSFRNVIMHVNKRMERELKIKTVYEGKKQVFKLLQAFQEILDGVKPIKVKK